MFVEREMAQGPALVWRRAAIGLRMQAGLKSPTFPRSPRRGGAGVSPSPSSDVGAKVLVSGFEDDFIPSPLLLSKDALPQVVVNRAVDGQKNSDGDVAAKDDHNEDPFTIKKIERMTGDQFDYKLQSDIDGWCSASEEGLGLVWRFYDDLGRTTTMLQTQTHDPSRGSVTESVV